MMCLRACCACVGCGCFWGWVKQGWVGMLSGSRVIACGLLSGACDCAARVLCVVWLCGGVVCDLYSGCEHLYFLLCFLWFCLVFVGIRWMPWHQELMKDVVACDMPRGVGERALIRGFPNGGT